MPALDRLVQPLRAGELLSQEEFVRRWEALPSLKRAELIQGRVYLPSPVSNPHKWLHSLVDGWLLVYTSTTPGCRAGSDGTWLMLRDAPQPDLDLVILPDYGGQSRITGLYSVGAPELAAEVCLSSKARDLGPKLELYREAGVQEYLTVMHADSSVTWRYLAGGQYTEIAPDTAGVLRSRVFPGLWLDVPALFANDPARLLSTLQQGLCTVEHERFVGELAAHKSGT
ncbi:MAG: Uma2 family endonuclease [Acidobacteriota bacterium]|nr:Uma2 family endonuclease [Acidobacteriota bacterium]